jgi:hypothetical protein
MVLREAVLASPAITGPVLCVSFLQPSKERDEAVRDLPIDLESLGKLQIELLPRLWAAARDGRLWKLRMVALLIYCLRDWSGVGEVRKWLAEALLEPRIAMIFLREMLQVTEVSGGRGTHAFYSLYAKQIEEFVDLEKLAEKTAGVSEDELVKAAVAALQKAVASKKAGQPREKVYVMSRDASGRLFKNPSDEGL